MHSDEMNKKKGEDKTGDKDGIFITTYGTLSV